MPSRAIDPLSPLVRVAYPPCPFFQCESETMTSSLLAFITMPGPMEMLIILAIMLLLFGNRLPSVMRNLGVSAREFKKGVAGMEEDLNDATKTPAAKEEKHE